MYKRRSLHRSALINLQLLSVLRTKITTSATTQATFLRKHWRHERTSRYCTSNIFRVVKISDRMRTRFEKIKEHMRARARASALYIPGVKLRRTTAHLNSTGTRERGSSPPVSTIASTRDAPLGKHFYRSNGSTLYIGGKKNAARKSRR